ncbi:MAG: sugar kinase [Ruminiclostridium sp.]
MPELITMGETMVSFLPNNNNLLRYVNVFSKRYAGAESNVAIGICKLGHSSGWISKLGHDEFGYFINNQIRGEGVDTSHVSFVSDMPTGLMFKEISGSSESKVFYYRKNSATSAMTPQDIPEDYIASAKILHLTGITMTLSQSCAETVNYAIDVAKKHDVMVSFDPNIRLKLCTKEQSVPAILKVLKRSDIVLLGEDEAKFLLNLQENDEIIDELLRLGIRKIALKQGDRGAYVADCEDRYQCDVFPAKKVDTIGAGDAFNAGFLCGILENRPLKECNIMGCAMGSFAIASQGDIEALPSREKLDALISGSTQIYR